MNIHTMKTRSNTMSLFAFFVLVAVSLTLLLMPAQAQQDPAATPTNAATITFTGTIDSVDTRFIVVNGLLVDLIAADYPTNQLALGVTVTVFGNLQNGIINAIFLQFGDDDDGINPNLTETPVTVTPIATAVPTTPIAGTPTVTVTPSDDDELGPRIIIEGPVNNITINTIQIFDIDINIAPTTVIVNNISIGDNVRVEGNLTIVNNVINIIAVNITIINIDSRNSFDSFRPGPPHPDNRGSRSSRSSRSS